MGNLFYLDWLAHHTGILQRRRETKEENYLQKVLEADSICQCLRSAKNEYPQQSPGSDLFPTQTGF